MAAPRIPSIELPGTPDPHRALRRLEGSPGRILLESAGPRGRFTLLAARPVEVFETGEVATRGARGPGWRDPFEGVAELLRRWGGGSVGGAIPDAAGSEFRGAAMGYLAYEAGGWLERLPAPPPDDVGLPVAWFGVYECAAIWDRATGLCRVSGALLPGRREADLRAAMEVLADAVAGAGNERGSGAERPGDAAGPGVGNAPAESGRASDGLPSGIVSSLSRDEFVAGVERIRSLVRRGDLFQANLTRRLTVPTDLDGVALYERLVRESPAEFAAYLDTGGAEVASVSPELFLSLHGGRLETSPIKGTARRGRDAEEDRRLREALAASEKDRAENVMIVDLMRNDLSRVARPGTVEVPRLLEIETLPTVHHLVSTVTARVVEGVGPTEVLRATFPGGSISGAPKIRAMEVLAELEPVRRGVYTGALGQIGLDGTMDLSIAIRTAVLKDGLAHYGTGAGITLASNAEAEWIETEDKASAFVRAVAGARAGAAGTPRPVRERVAP